jgi:hypothetical protein
VESNVLMDAHDVEWTEEVKALVKPEVHRNSTRDAKGCVSIAARRTLPKLPLPVPDYLRQFGNENVVLFEEELAEEKTTIDTLVLHVVREITSEVAVDERDGLGWNVWGPLWVLKV